MRGVSDERARLGRRTLWSALAICAALLTAAPVAFAHIERASYWPDPAVDKAGGEPTGGKVPELRTLGSALKKKPPGRTRVVCQGKVTKKPGKKLKRLKAAGDTAKLNKVKRNYSRKLRRNKSYKAFARGLKKARRDGYKLRPSEPAIVVTKKQSRKLKKLNRRFVARCKFSSIQEAVTKSGNNDRVVIMPGTYTEPKSRAAPTNDPKCDGLEEMNDRADGSSYQTGANSYRYVATCPNDQNLIAVIGREPGPAPPQPPLMERRGIPDNGPCIRCNLQMEGSGVSPDDVIIDAGRVESGNGSPADPVKDVGIKADRADGFVLRNVTVRHVREHAIYPHEVDGYRLERFKTFQAEEYGTLQFAADHGLVQDCETAGSGDAGIYPGSAPDTGEQSTEGSRRLNTEITRCDMHHNSAGYSGTAGNAVWIHHNDFYDNALGLTTDVFTAAGHPGFPQDSDLIENNEFYSNNFNPYVDQPNDNEVVPTIPVPVGTAMWIAGGNGNEFRNNRVWDNWRRGVMLFAVPDSFVCGPNPPANGNQQAGCTPGAISTSHRNRFHDNIMGIAPNGEVLTNGDGNALQGRTDFWWDSFLNNNGNCWYDNQGAGGAVTTTPATGLPSDCGASTGTSGVSQEAELLACLAAFEGGVGGGCDWFTTPPKP